MATIPFFRSLFIATLATALRLVSALISTSANSRTHAVSVLAFFQNSSFFSDSKNQASDASVIFPIENAIASGGKIDEANAYSSTPLGNALAAAVTRPDGVGGNPIEKATIRLGGVLDQPIGPKREEVYPLCFPFVWGAVNIERVHILLSAGATKAIKFNGMTPIEVARQQTLDPNSSESQIAIPC